MIYPYRNNITINKIRYSDYSRHDMKKTSSISEEKHVIVTNGSHLMRPFNKVETDESLIALDIPAL